MGRFVDVIAGDPAEMGEAATIDRYKARGLFTCDGCAAAGRCSVPAAGLYCHSYCGPEVVRDFGVEPIRVMVPACDTCLARLEAGDPGATRAFAEVAAHMAALAYLDSIPDRN